MFVNIQNEYFIFGHVQTTKLDWNCRYHITILRFYIASRDFVATKKESCRSVNSSTFMRIDEWKHFNYPIKKIGQSIEFLEVL